jgi:hypothetical protein
MNSYKKILVEYLRSIGQLEAHQLGAVSTLRLEEKERLSRELKRQYDRNQLFIWLSTGLWVVLFGVGISFALHYRNTPTGLSVALGGNVMALSGVMLALRRLWLDSSLIGALLSILPGLTPAEAAKVITTFYFDATEKKDRRRP